MTKIDIISGFLGAGKTTLIKKLLSEAFKGEQVVLIENEFGEIGIDGGFLKESGIEIREMNSGCICCSLVGDFGKSLREVVDTYHPDRILIEPSGVGKLSDVIKAVQDVQGDIDAVLNSFSTVVDVTKCRIYRKNFGEFFSNQIEYAGAVILSRTDKAKPEKVEESVALLRKLNSKAPFITTPIAQLPGEKILETMESGKTLEEELLDEIICPECGHHHEHGECCGHDHDHDHEDGHHHSGGDRPSCDQYSSHGRPVASATDSCRPAAPARCDGSAVNAYSSRTSSFRGICHLIDSDSIICRAAADPCSSERTGLIPVHSACHMQFARTVQI